MTTPLIVLRPDPASDMAIEWPDDVARMKGILQAAGYTATDHDIQWAWGEHSETYAAGWLSLYRHDHEILGTLLVWLKPSTTTEGGVR